VELGVSAALISFSDIPAFNHVKTFTDALLFHHFCDATTTHQKKHGNQQTARCFS
jgi:hypothetical protein